MPLYVGGMSQRQKILFEHVLHIHESHSDTGFSTHPVGLGRCYETLTERLARYE